MTAQVLVTYASHGGSTAGVAQAIGESLRARGVLVDVLPMRKVKGLESYQAVVAGSAIHDKEWLPEALDFLDRFEGALYVKPFAAFLVCMTLALKNEQLKVDEEVLSWMDSVRTRTKPLSEGFFAGTLDLDTIPDLWDRLRFTVSTMLGVWEEGDHRDWNAIQAWADELHSIFAL